MLAFNEDPQLAKQEIARIGTLFKQSLNGIVLVPFYSIPYVYVSWGVLSHNFLIGWAGAYHLIGILRVLIALYWRKRQDKLTLAQARRFHIALNVLLFSSGAVWFPIAWMFPYSTLMQQLLAAMCMTFMSAGGIVLFASSLLSTYLLVLPPSTVFIIAMFQSPDPAMHVVGWLGAVYALAGMVVARTANRYVNESLRTMVKYSKAKEELRESAESLKMALSSSGSNTWSWDLKTKMICCEGDLREFGIEGGSICGTERQYFTLMDPDMRGDVRERFLGSLGQHGEIEIEHLLQVPGHGTVYLAIRGRALFDEHGEIVAFKGICWDATGKRTEEVLRHERDVQEAANKAKSVFLANASHEMRTPLAAISGYTEALLDSTLPPKVRHDLQVVQRTGRYLTSLVNDFLDLSRIETGQLFIQKNTINPEKEIHEVLQMIKPSLDLKNVKLMLEVTTLLPDQIETDQTRLRQILINMLSNSAKYTESGEVRVRVSYDLRSDGKALLSIRVIDSGVGISDQVRNNLFRPFVRGETAFIKRTEGAGLGLALSRSLARALGGDLNLVRSMPDQGSEFEFTLTLEAAPSMALKVIEQRKDAYIQPVSALPLDGVRILVAEDSQDLRELMERVLHTKGAAVEVCGDGAQAVDMAVNGNFDLILMDINMPVMDGYQATASLRAKGYAKPIIALTAHASIEHRQLALEAGCDYYLSKPINTSSLIEILRKSVRPAAKDSSPEKTAQL